MDEEKVYAYSVQWVADQLNRNPKLIERLARAGRVDARKDGHEWRLSATGVIQVMHLPRKPWKQKE